MHFRIFPFIFCIPAISSQALWIQNPDGNIHDWDRMEDIDDNRGGAQFIGYNFDWSGVGRSSDGRWATLISNQYFLSANHFKPGNGQTITFFKRDFNSGVVSTFSRTVESGQLISGTDLWVGKLSSPINTVTNYSIYSGTPPNAFLNLGQEDFGGTLPRPDSPTNDVTNILMIVGLGHSSGDNSSLSSGISSFRVGLNATNPLTNDFDNRDGLFPFNVGDTIAYRYNQDGVGGSLFDDYEAFFQGGDSGGPTFYAPNSQTDSIIGNGTPANMLLFGIHAGQNGGPNPSSGSFSVDSLPGLHLAEINAIIAIPESRETALLLGFASLLALVLLRRHN